MSSPATITDELSATANEAVVRPFFTAGFLLGFGTLLCLLSHRITALIARRVVASSVHLATLILLAVSVLFVFISSVLVVGSGPTRAERVCKASIWLWFASRVEHGMAAGT